MRWLIWIAVAATALWGGYWFIGSTGAEAGLRAWFDGRRAEGWVADYASLDTNGFPSRFDTTITGLELADPDTGLAWSAPFFQILTLSYTPNQFIVVWPDRQAVSTPRQRIEIGAGDMRGSVIFDANTDLSLNRATIALEAMTFGSTLGWSSSLEGGQLAARQSAGRPRSYDIAFEARGLTPAAEFVRRLDSSTLLPPVIDGMNIDATVEFTAPWDRFAIEDARPQVAAIDLKLLKANWGELDLWMAGSVTVDAAGIPSGKVTVKARNWREMVGIARNAGLLPEPLVGTLVGALEMLSGLSGDPETLDAPLTLANGRVRLGPFPLGPAPRLRIR